MSSTGYPEGSIGWFIQIVLQQELKEIIDKDYHFLGFTLISVGIEFLGACRSDDFTGQNTGNKFKIAIEKLFGTRYKGLEDTLYKNLRCGMAHRFSPQSKKGPKLDPVVLTERKNLNSSGIKHLDKDSNGNLVLVSEDFYADFKVATENLVDYLLKESPERLHKPYLSISRTLPASTMNPSTGSTPVSGGTI